MTLAKHVNDPSRKGGKNSAPADGGGNSNTNLNHAQLLAVAKEKGLQANKNNTKAELLEMIEAAG